MKNITKVFIGATLALAALGQPTELDAREHRAMWMTPFLSSNWPSSAITESNANSLKNILVKRLDKFKSQNINVLYYHCRAMCDATYESSYEPWSSNVSGKRGQAPAFDPFGFLVETAHQKGIEVYAWINPYRYCSSKKYGEGELNYENSHPDWLLSQSKETILNPALEEVKQRIVDVISEIVTKYDVDGVIFDDYFYTNGTPMSLDAADYKKYTDGGGTLSQADWRRANINDMVARVNKAIKAIKPWVSFGVGPAGVASPPTVTSEYGLPAAPGGGDWQYNGIYSDPLAWFKQGSIDFMSPQIYWPSRFDALSKWWADAAMKYDRHCYPSVDLSSMSSPKGDEVSREILQSRLVSPADASGLVYFEYATFVNSYQKFDGKTTELGDVLAKTVYTDRALVPLRPWTNSVAPATVTNIRVDGDTLRWDEPADVKNRRYVVYTKNGSGLDITDILYTNKWAIPADEAANEHYVAVYDRYANIYTPMSVGGELKTGTKPELTYPVKGQLPVDLFNFSWKHDGTNVVSGRVELSDEPEFGKVLASVEYNGTPQVSISDFPPLNAGQTYYWRVVPTDVNTDHPVSDIESFVAARIALTSPADGDGEVSYNPVITYTPAVEGSEYTVEISRVADFVTVEHTGTTTELSYTVPERVLCSGRNYYARVTARHGNAVSQSPVAAFSTVNKTDYAAPVFVHPTEQTGVIMHSDESAEIKPWDGLVSVTVNVAADPSFPSRSMYSEPLNGFATKTKAFGDIKISSKNLVEGQTYYLRARGSYVLTTSTSNQYTDYSPTYSFTYSAETGVSDLTVDENATWLENSSTLHVGAGVDKVTVYDLGGATVATYQGVEAGSTVDLSELPAGAYLIRAGQTTLKLVR